jgi:hypothetical protein
MGKARKAVEKVGDTALQKVAEKVVDALIHWVVALQGANRGHAGELHPMPRERHSR